MGKRAPGHYGMATPLIACDTPRAIFFRQLVLRCQEFREDSDPRTVAVVQPAICAWVDQNFLFINIIIEMLFRQTLSTGTFPRPSHV